MKTTNDNINIDFNSSDVAIVISFSGGKDSTAMLADIVNNYPNAKKYVVMADTGFEHDDAIEWSHKIVESFGLTLNVVNAVTKDGEVKTFQSMVRGRGKFPSSSCRQCTSDLKRCPIFKWIRNNVSEPIIINAMGLRADESRARAKKLPFVINNRQSNGVRTVYDWLPIFTWTTDETIAFLADNNLPLHPAYKYLSRFSCRMCIMMKKSDVVAVYDNDREGFEMMSDLEKEIDFTMFNGTTLIQLVTDEKAKA